MPYTACVLEDISRGMLAEFMLRTQQPADHFEVLCHHMTIDLKPIAKSMGKEFDGQRHEMKVVRVGRLDGIMAVEVETVVPSKNSRKHITLCCDRVNGWKPVKSNDITEWTDVEPFTLFGVVQEVA